LKRTGLQQLLERAEQVIWEDDKSKVDRRLLKDGLVAQGV
jgi:hypothetical protein